MMPSDPAPVPHELTAPSRDASAGRRLHPFTLLFASLGLARRLILPAAVGGLSGADGDPTRLIVWVVGILAIPAIIVAALRYATFRYRVTGDELVIDSGVLQRKHRVIPLANVQNIDLRESALQRAAGVVEMRVETAGSGSGAEASLEVLGRAEAHALREELLARRRELRAAPRTIDDVSSSSPADDAAPAATRRSIVETDPAPPPVEVLARLDAGRLALAGATANEAGLIAAALAAALQLVDDFALERMIPFEAVMSRVADSTVSGAIWLVAIMLGALLVLGWLVSIVGSVVGYHDFTLERVGGDLRKHYGLIGRRQTSVPLERVQAVRVEESLLRRPLRLATLKIETASGSPREQRRRGSEAFVPIATAAEVPDLLRGVLPDLNFGGAQFQPVHPRSRRRSFLRHLFVALVLLSAASIMALLRTGGLPRALPLWAVTLGALSYGLAAWQHRHRGWALHGGYVLARSGVLNRVTWVIPHAKIQTLHLVSSPFQRRHGLTTLIIDTASGGRQGRVMDLGEDVGGALLAELVRSARAARRVVRRSRSFDRDGMVNRGEVSRPS